MAPVEIKEFASIEQILFFKSLPLLRNHCKLQGQKFNNFLQLDFLSLPRQCLFLALPSSIFSKVIILCSLAQIKAHVYQRRARDDRMSHNRYIYI